MSREQLLEQKNLHMIQMNLFLDLLEKLDEIYVHKKNQIRGDALMEYNLLGATNKVQQKLEQNLDTVRSELVRIDASLAHMGKKRASKKRSHRKCNW
jgi:hypothetical protein